jgi:sodium pump decarboxylase gamma subunit
MSYVQILIQAARVMALGMGVVFFFLALLVVASKIMSCLLVKYAEPEPAVERSKDGAVVTAITVAMQQYLHDKKKDEPRGPHAQN